MMPGADERLREFLRETLALWAVEGEVLDADPGAVAVIMAADGTRLRIERAHAVSAFRWIVRTEHANAGTSEPRERPCASWVGVLSALRRAFGIERGSAIRIAAAADP